MPPPSWEALGKSFNLTFANWKGYLVIQQLDLGRSNNMYKAVCELHETCLEGERCHIKDTKSDQLNFELVAFKFELTLGEFNNLNLCSIGMYFKKFCCRLTFSRTKWLWLLLVGNTCFEHSLNLGKFEQVDRYLPDYGWRRNHLKFTFGSSI